MKLGGVFAGERALHDEEEGDVVGSESLEGLGKFEEAVIEHELDTPGDLIGLLIFEVGGGASRDGGVKNEESAELDGGVFKILVGPGVLKEVGAVGDQLGQDAGGGGFLKRGEKFGRDFAGQESGGKLLDC